VSVLKHPKLTVHRTGDFVAPRKWVHLTGLGPFHDLGVHNQTIDVLERALLERAYMCDVGDNVFCPPLPTCGEEWSEMNLFGKLLDKYNGRYWHPVTAVDVVNMYKGAKREAYEQARISFEADPLIGRLDTRSSVFAKFEKANIGKAPRCIQPRSARYNLRVGRFIKPIEKRIYRSIARAFRGFGCTTPVVIKGYNVDVVAGILFDKWSRYSDPICIGLDAKKFDMHVSVSALEFEHSVYLNMYRNNPELVSLLKHQIKNRGVGYCKDGRLKFEIDGIRFSGDMNTALGNCIIMCALIWTWANKIGVCIELGNNGDDCVVFMERSDEELFTLGLEEWFESKGFRMDVEPTVDEFEAVEFCQSHPVFNGECYTMVRSLPTVLQKDSMCLIPINKEKDFLAWATAVGMCGGSLSTGIPVLQSFYSAFRRNGKGVLPSEGMLSTIYRNTGQYERMAGKEHRVRQIEDDARVSFWIATGITPDLQRIYEDYYDGYGISWQNGCIEYSATQIKDSCYYIEITQEQHSEWMS